MNKDEHFMSIALEEAKIAYSNNEVPVGCVIVKGNDIIAKSHNTRHNKKSATNHAEINAINEACEILDSWILEDCEIYITLEPCIMCAGAIIQSRIKRVIYAATEPKFGAAESILNIFNNMEYKFNHEVEVTSNVLKDESTKLLKDFFKKLRENK